MVRDGKMRSRENSSRKMPRCGLDHLTVTGVRRFIGGMPAHHPIDRLAAVDKTAQLAAPADLQASF
jgi:hypothetical protein